MNKYFLSKLKSSNICPVLLPYKTSEFPLNAIIYSIFPKVLNKMGNIKKPIIIAQNKAIFEFRVMLQQEE